MAKVRVLLLGCLLSCKDTNLKVIHNKEVIITALCMVEMDETDVEDVCSGMLCGTRLACTMTKTKTGQ